jgi:hypothetical protein
MRKAVLLDVLTHNCLHKIRGELVQLLIRERDKERTICNTLAITPFLTCLALVKFPAIPALPAFLRYFVAPAVNPPRLYFPSRMNAAMSGKTLIK